MKKILCPLVAAFLMSAVSAEPGKPAIVYQPSSTGSGEYKATDETMTMCEKTPENLSGFCSGFGRTPEEACAALAQLYAANGEKWATNNFVRGPSRFGSNTNVDCYMGFGNGMSIGSVNKR